MTNATSADARTEAENHDPLSASTRGPDRPTTADTPPRGSTWSPNDPVADGSGRLVLAGTPIGDVDSVSPALREGLAHADIIAAEDTRRFADLARRASMEYHGRVVSYFEANESAKTPDLVNQMLAGSTIVLVTDAGMPSVSDPGFRLVTAAIDAGIIVSAIPGPSAVLTALAVSGIESDRFCFEGFLPRKPGPRASRLAQLAAEPRTMIFFEAPHRLADFLQAATGAFGPHRRGAICRELTKTYEQVVRGPLSELADWAEDHARGEITVVIAGAPPREPDIDELVGEVQSRMKAGEKRSAAVAAVALAAHADRRALYDATLKAAGRAS